MMERLKQSSVLRVALAVMVTNCLTYIFCLYYTSSDTYHQSKFYMTYILYSDPHYVVGQEYTLFNRASNHTDSSIFPLITDEKLKNTDD